MLLPFLFPCLITRRSQPNGEHNVRELYRQGKCDDLPDRKGGVMARYGKGAKKSVSRAMHKRKKGTLKSGSGKKVKSRKQAIAIGLSEARRKGKKVPKKK